MAGSGGGPRPGEAWARWIGFRPAARWPHLLPAFEGVDFTPLADIEEYDTAWTIEAELPGVDKNTGALRRRRRVTRDHRLQGRGQPAARSRLAELMAE